MENKNLVIVSENAPKALGPYSQGILSGHFLFISGQVPIDIKTGCLVESADIKTQTKLVLDHLEAILLEGGATWNEVVRCDVFLTSLTHFSSFNEEYAKRFKERIPPARQTIEVSGLPLGALVEISCIAHLNH